MSGVNKVILLGRLGKDPEVRHLESGVSVANFSVATSEVYRDKATGERREITEWHHVTLWRRLAEVAEKYLHKGDMVYIEGKLRTRSWEKDGVVRYTTEVIGDTMTMVGGGRPATEAHPSAQELTAPSPSLSTSPPKDDAADDLPF